MSKKIKRPKRKSNNKLPYLPYTLPPRKSDVPPHYSPDSTIKGCEAKPQQEKSDEEIRREGNEFLRKKFQELVSARVSSASSFMDRCNSDDGDAKKYLSGVIAGIIICREIAEMTIQNLMTGPFVEHCPSIFLAGESINVGDMVVFDTATGRIKKASPAKTLTSQPKQ